MRFSPVLLACSLFAVPVMPAIAGPKEPDYICYMTDQLGKVQDLSAALCGFGFAQAVVRATPSTGRPSTSRVTPTGGAVTSSQPAVKQLPYRAGNGMGTTSPQLQGKSYSCYSFETLAEAQLIFTYDPQNDPFDLDSDKDGLLCEGTLTRSNGVGNIPSVNTAPNFGTGSGYTGNCPTPDSIAADGKRCGKRAASERPGGYP